MTNSNQNHEFDYLNENSGDSSPEFNSTKGNHRSTQATLVADDDISPEEEQLLAGYNPTANHLISEEYRLKQDAEGAVERPLAEKPSVRLGSVVGLVGMAGRPHHVNKVVLFSIDLKLISLIPTY